MTATRILHVTQVYAGGISRAITSLVELMPEVEHHLLWAGDEPPAPETPYVSVHQMPQSPRSMLTAIRRVREVVDEVRPDVIHAHSSFGGVYTRLASVKAPVFYQPHCYKFDDLQQPAPLRVAYRMAERVLASRAECVVVLSPHEEHLAKSLHSGARTHFVPNVATVRPTEKFRASGFGTANTVFMIGRLTGQKDPEFFAEVAERTRMLRPDVKFKWIGDGDAVTRARLEAAGVEVRGWLVGDDLSRELSEPALYFHSAHYEGFPLSVLDAAAFEHPIAVRGIPTFEGLGLASATTTQQSAKLIDEILGGGPQHELAVATSKQLDSRMNSTAQRESLRTLYDNVQGRSHYGQTNGGEPHDPSS